jgi:hypothetical protein
MHASFCRRCGSGTPLPKVAFLLRPQPVSVAASAMIRTLCHVFIQRTILSVSGYSWWVRESEDGIPGQRAHCLTGANSAIQPALGQAVVRGKGVAWGEEERGQTGRRLRGVRKQSEEIGDRAPGHGAAGDHEADRGCGVRPGRPDFYIPDTEGWGSRAGEADRKRKARS